MLVVTIDGARMSGSGTIVRYAVALAALCGKPVRIINARQRRSKPGLASTMGAYNPMSYHNGSVWPHDTAIAVAGLLRYRHLPGAVRLGERLANGLLAAADAFEGRLPELFCGFPRSRFYRPVPYPTACSPQAWASAAPLLLVRSFLGLTPHVPQRTLTVIPHLPQRWGKLALTDLRLGPATVQIQAEGEAVTARGVP